MAHSDALLTIIESPLFNKLWPDYWTEDERGEFAAFIANNPDAGDVIPGSGGAAKFAGVDQAVVSAVVCG